MFRLTIACLALVGSCVAFGAGPAPSNGASTASTVDVELAFDTTGSMAPSLARARQDAEKILSGVRAVVPAARFAVVAFRDPGNPGGEYQTLQPLTTDTGRIERALARLKSVHNTSPDNLDVELYNLAFHRSFVDSGLGWGTTSRKIVVVMGDAEGYGGGSAGLTGCTDTHAAPTGLDMRAQLAGMRAAKLTLVMIRENSPYTTASLDCYASMASQTYIGGAARDGNAADLVTPLVALVRGALAPITISTRSPLVMPGTKTAFTVAVTNPNSSPLMVSDLTVRAPRAFSSVDATPAPTTSGGNTLSWKLALSLAPRSRFVIRVTATADLKPRVAALTAAGNFQLSTDTTFSSDAAAQLHVTKTILAEAAAKGAQGAISGRATFSLAPGRSLSAFSGSKVSGRYTFTRRGQKVVLEVTGYRLDLKRAHALARMSVRVAGEPKALSCRRGTHGTLTVTDRSYSAASGKATLRLDLPRCHAAGIVWPALGGAIRPIP